MESQSSKKQKYELPRCPNCSKRGGITAPISQRTPDGRIRKRSCRLCGYWFDTEMKLPPNCPYCDAQDQFRVRQTRNLRNGVYRLYRCKACQRNTATFEPFPIPDEKRRRPDFRII